MLTDFRYAVRSLLRAPSFAVLLIATLAIGIGPTTTMFSIVDSLLIRDLPYRDADSIITVARSRVPGEAVPVSVPDFIDFRTRNTVFSDMAAATARGDYNISGVDEPLRVLGSAVTPNLFALLGAKPFLGSIKQNEVVLSHGLWHRTFGEKRDIIGRTVRINGSAMRIAAVMPRRFSYPGRAELWIPGPLPEHDRGYHQLRVVGRLKPGVTLAQAEAELARLARQIGDENPSISRGIGVRLATLREALVGDVRRTLLVLFGAVVFLLLIACSNAANLLLTRAAGRQRELAIRGAVGATRGRLARQLLFESLLLSLAGGVTGLLLAYGGVAIVRATSDAYLSRPELLAIDGRVLAFNFAVAVLTGVLFGLAPLTMNLTMRGITRGSTIHSRLRDASVVTVVAFTFLLLVGAGLLIRSFVHARNVDVGIRPDGLVTMRIALPERTYPTTESTTAFCLRLLDRIPQSATVSGLPTANINSGNLRFPGEERVARARRIVTISAVSPGWFGVAGIPLLEGRDFTREDTAPRQVVIISRTMARRYWPSRSPLGEQVLVGSDDRATIVGVVADVRQSGVTYPPTAHVYLPLGMPVPFRATNIVVRSSRPTKEVVEMVQRELRALDPDIPPYLVRTMDEVLDDGVAGRGFLAMILGIFAAIALTLSTIGIYGVIAYGVTQRTRELGIRMAAGATATHVLRLVIGRVVVLASIGIAFGAAGALVLTRWLESLLYQVSPADPWAFAAVAALLLVTAILASARPASRASRVEPAVCLRWE
ncbi:MAG TPA: ABC transporter permease [Thermoanaerobaculia bacterium]